LKAAFQGHIYRYARAYVWVWQRDAARERQQERGRQRDAAREMQQERCSERDAGRKMQREMHPMLHTTLKSFVGMGADRVGYGHTFAAQDESDQALAAYRTASRFFSGMS